MIGGVFVVVFGAAGWGHCGFSPFDSARGTGRGEYSKKMLYFHVVVMDAEGFCANKQEISTVLCGWFLFYATFIAETGWREGRR